nr:MAG TPA: hypothetical protein [Inoviridae sp.]
MQHLSERINTGKVCKKCSVFCAACSGSVLPLCDVVLRDAQHL